MDSLTEQAYNEKADEYYSRFRSVRHDWESLFSSDSHGVRKILDIGCGSGENILRFRELGWDAYGTECSAGLRERILRDHPELAIFIGTESLPFGDSLVFGGSFTHIICRAVLQHIPPKSIFQSLFGIRSHLALGGFLSLSFPFRRSDLDREFRDGDGRLHQLHEPERIQLMLERMGFVTIHRRLVSDGLGREGVEWVEILVQRKSLDVHSLDCIEAIISRDKKTATYKLALLRALCDLASTESKSLPMRDSFVHIPLIKIAEKWLLYYIPFVSDGRIAQITGASKNTSLKFEKELRSLLELHSYNLGSYNPGKIVQILASLKRDLADPIFWVFWKGGKLSGGKVSESFILLKSVLRQIIATLVSGPIAFTKGSGSEPVFGLDSSREFVLVPFGLWRELVVFDHWIRDAILIQWAEVSTRFSRMDGVTHSEVLDRLMFDFFPDRNQSISRGLFMDMKPKICVWSNRSLEEGFDMDHLIPFSLSRNNMLWNLLPIDSRVNRRKSDKLPHHNLILKRKENLLRCWRWIADQKDYSPRFFSEVSSFTGLSSDSVNGWEAVLFDAFLESVESIAVHRGVERWG